MKEIEDVVKRYEKIARDNGDEFSIRINVDRDRRTKKISYEFEVIETCDGHKFSYGHGDSISGAIVSALETLPDDLRQWGYIEKP